MNERRLVWTLGAQRDLEFIVEYIAEQQPATALNVLNRLQARTAGLASQTLCGRHVPELRGMGLDNHREIIAPWRIIDRPASKHLYLVAAFDAAALFVAC